MPDEIEKEIESGEDHSAEAEETEAGEESEEDEEAEEEEAEHYPGGVLTPPGYKLLGCIPNDDGSVRFPLDDLLENVQIDGIDGVSVALDRAGADYRYGTVHGRIIHDFSGVAYVFRKDHPDQGRTHIKVALGHVGLTAI